MEGIPGPGASIYSGIVAKSPFIRDFYQLATKEVCAQLSSGRMLDIGTGPGLLPLEIARKSSGLEINAIDISSKMVDIATKNAVKAGLAERVKFQYGSAEHIPLQDAHFDLVMTTLSFHHWARPFEGLQEVRRVLKPDSELWIYEIKWDITKEDKQRVKEKYGWFLSFLILNFVRGHSSLSLKKIHEVRSYTNLGFSEITTEDRGLFVKLRMVK